MKYQRENNLGSYLELLENGFIEYGNSYKLFRKYDNESYLYGTELLAYCSSLLSFAKQFYDFLGYDAKITLQINFSDVINFLLGGFHSKYSNSFRHYRNENIFRNVYHTNFKIVIKDIAIAKITDNEIKQHIQFISRKMHQAFNLVEDYCLVDGNIDINVVRNL